MGTYCENSQLNVDFEFMNWVQDKRMFKTRQQTQNGVTYDTKTRLPYSLSSPRNERLNQSLRNHLLSPH